jgi:hypothetical protein
MAAVTLEERILALSNQLGIDNKALKTIQGNLSALSTTQKGSIVLALNEVYTMASAAASSGGATINNTTPTDTTTYSSNKINAAIAALINDAAVATTNVWSASKTDSSIKAAVAALVGSAPTTLDTIAELATALGDANAITAINTALGNRVRHDINNQGLTTTQQANARTNIGAAASADIGTSTDFLAAYTASKV